MENQVSTNVNNISDLRTDVNTINNYVDTTNISTTVKGSGYEGAATYTLIRKGSVVYITGTGTRPTYAVPLAYNLITVPAQYRPAHMQYFSAIAGAADGSGTLALATCSIRPSGSIQMEFRAIAPDTLSQQRVYNSLYLYSTYSLI